MDWLKAIEHVLDENALAGFTTDGVEEALHDLLDWLRRNPDVWKDVEPVKRGYVIYDNITDEFFTGFDADEEWSWSHKESDITAAAFYSCKDDASAVMSVMSRKFQENGHRTDFEIRWAWRGRFSLHSYSNDFAIR